MSPAQEQAWENWIGTAYSGLYWQYAAARLGKVIVFLNVISGVTGDSALALLLADHPLLTKLVALAAARGHALCLLLRISGRVRKGQDPSRVLFEISSAIRKIVEPNQSRPRRGRNQRRSR